MKIKQDGRLPLTAFVSGAKRREILEWCLRVTDSCDRKPENRVEEIIGAVFATLFMLAFFLVFAWCLITVADLRGMP